MLSAALNVVWRRDICRFLPCSIGAARDVAGRHSAQTQMSQALTLGHQDRSVRVKEATSWCAVHCVALTDATPATQLPAPAALQRRWFPPAGARPALCLGFEVGSLLTSFL